jgi:mono/diheme cytochrome c family protein
MLAGAGLAAAGLLGACHHSRAPGEGESAGDMGAQCEPETPVARGKYLVAIAGCSDCHTPMKMGEKGPRPDLDRYLSGHPQELKMPPAPKLGGGPWVSVVAGTTTAFAGPWGVTFSANLTPDPQTGLGIWTESMFVKAMRTGKHFGEGRPIMPPMPWESTGHMSDDDLKAVYAYLRSIPPVKNQVPEYEPPG